MYGRIDLGTCKAGGPFVWSRWHWDWDESEGMWCDGCGATLGPGDVVRADAERELARLEGSDRVCEQVRARERVAVLREVLGWQGASDAGA